MISPQFILYAETLMAAALTVGAVLARRRRFRLHAPVQASVVGANLVAIVTVMLPSLRAGLHSRVAAIHSAVGVAAELLSIYVVLAAGTGWLPPRWRFSNYKPWMRAALGLWLAAFALGAVTYRTGNGATAQFAPAGAFDIQIRNFRFDPAELVVPPGATVRWIDEAGRHSIRADDGSFHSETLTAGGVYTHRFSQPGLYRYFCEFHGAAGGHDMAGLIRVR